MDRHKQRVPGGEREGRENFERSRTLMNGSHTSWRASAGVEGRVQHRTNRAAAVRLLCHHNDRVSS